MESSKETISGFFCKNQALMTGIALFVALTELSRSYITIPVWGHTLSFMFLGLAIFLTVDLFRGFPKELSDSLYLFRAFFLITMSFFCLYWFIINLDIIVYILLGCLLGFLIGGLLIFCKRLRFGKRWKHHI